MAQKIGIIGFGTMGSGIAQAAVEAGFEVVAVEQKAEFFDRGLSGIQKNWNRGIEKGRLTEEKKKEYEALLTTTTEWEALGEVSFIIEAVSENMALKKELFAKLDKVAAEGVVMATNTSGLSVTEIASVTNRADKVIGVHFFNPVPVMKLVELIRGQSTSEETYQAAKEVVEKIGKDPIDVKEAPLFAVNRILVPMINEAIFVLMEGTASAEDIDKGMKLGANHPIGPLALADLIGLDTLLYVQDSLYEETQDSKYRSAPLLRKLVRAGHLGRKSGKGFYDYTKGTK
ncbi:3-hydroxybutyryl-CoA dehydrogenase [Aneurinibacillus soli]|uniref:Putative 3-hydroxybutyryl-CoA dehydrogenase n=1 Tax=Aneurinibacillus soli TaxID=1500254 RepID=A0A0U5BDM8_9BACL|nr:3-hydroxybutyryl-CoA dehydrogenase [Aneurinibacillus soli]PYE57807.1 3-hydroxybutyryl-CoA dehydrogenase [Aneurinibacillus soli]BAU26238.1 putative 3-hydroxybutyryl-CoA dehydrogenase [Aneurinibacillus soli]